MKVTIASLKTATLLKEYGFPLSNLCSREMLDSILSPEDLFNHSRFVGKIKYHTSATYEWLREIVEKVEAGSDDNSPHPVMVSDNDKHAYVPLYHFSSMILGEDNLLIIIDETRVLQKTVNPLGHTSLEPFRELLTNLIHLNGTEALSYKLIPLYVRYAALKSFV